MSRTEVIDAVNGMDREDRAFFAAYLKAKDLSEDSNFAEESSRRLASMKAGDRIDSGSLKEIHDSLEKRESEKWALTTGQSPGKEPSDFCSFEQRNEESCLITSISFQQMCISKKGRVLQHRMGWGFQ